MSDSSVVGSEEVVRRIILEECPKASEEVRETIAEEANWNPQIVRSLARQMAKQKGYGPDKQEYVPPWQLRRQRAAAHQHA